MGPAPGRSTHRSKGRALRVLRFTSCLGLAYLASADAQPPVRRATNIAAILSYPSFYHMRPILLVGTVAQLQNGEFRVSDASGSLRVIPEGNAPDGVDEVRGQFWDLGRLKSDDPRLAGFDLKRTFHVDPEGAWPRPGEVTAIMASSIAPRSLPTGDVSAPGTTKSAKFPGASIRSIVLDAPRYLDQKVMITGQYYGRNLSGDLPDAPRRSRYDFVLRAADASIWVANVRPKGKDSRGRNFELGLDARIDTGKWLQVAGIVRQGRGLLWIDGDEETFALAQPPADTVVEEEPVRVPAAPPSEVVFSAPTEEETDVSLTTNVRIQFSRDLDPATFKGRIRVSYVEQPRPDTVATGARSVDFTTEYSAFNRVLELKFVKPLEQFRMVKIELLDGILGTDQQSMKPWTLTFESGGS